MPLVLIKALTLLDAILTDGGSSSIGTITARLCIPQATAYRLTSALVAHRLIVAGRRGHYRAGMLMVTAMADVSIQDIVAHVGMPLLTSMARRLRQVVHLGILEDDMVTYVCRAGSGVASRFTRLHTQLDAYCSGLGKILLAYLPAAQLTQYLSRGVLMRLTQNTIVDPSALTIHLKMIRQQGYAVDNGEFSEELACVAAPVFDARGRAFAAISISGPRSRLRGNKLTMEVCLLRQAAADISNALYRPQIKKSGM